MLFSFATVDFYLFYDEAADMPLLILAIWAESSRELFWAPVVRRLYVCPSVCPFVVRPFPIFDFFWRTT